MKGVELHCPCGATAPIGTPGWLDETWPTIGGEELHVVSCWECRRLVVPYAGSDRCNGRCGGYADTTVAALGECATCADADDNEWPPPDERTRWSCFDNNCVLAWAATHDVCSVDFTPGRAA